MKKINIFQCYSNMQNTLSVTKISQIIITVISVTIYFIGYKLFINACIQF